MTNIGNIQITIDYTGHERDMAIRTYVWDAVSRDILVSLESFSEDQIVMASLAHFRLRDLVGMILLLHPGAAVELHISNEARNYFEQQGALDKIEGAVEIARLAA